MAIISCIQSSIHYLFILNKNILKKNWVLNNLQLLDLATKKEEKRLYGPNPITKDSSLNHSVPQTIYILMNKNEIQ